jgi:hypothetical protein
LVNTQTKEQSGGEKQKGGIEITMKAERVGLNTDELRADSGVNAEERI